jgi:hypothetical protein
MNKAPARLLASGIALAALAAPAAANAARVTVRVEGARRTLVPTVTVSTNGRVVGQAGHPTCSGRSALGALDAASRGRWGGSYSTGLGYFVDTILGERHRGPQDFFDFWINHREATVGACAYTPRAGDQLLFFVARAKGAPTLPLALRAPATARAGQPFAVSVVAYSARGKPSPVAGASVAGGGVSVRTDRAGRARVTVRRRGHVELQATKPGRVRSATDAVRVRAAR